ncbi:MAG: hypothetical protein V1652_04035 [bacterium]
MREIELKRDKYKRARGGYSKLLELSCSQCATFVALYQKDGHGSLKRMYLDRIIAPETLVGLERTPFKELPLFTCTKCKHVLGAPFLYKKEKRPSFRLFEGSVGKKIIK